MNYLPLIIPVGIFLAILLVGWLVGHLWRAGHKRDKQAALEMSDTVPPPGQSLLEQIDPLRFVLQLATIQLITAPLLIAVAYTSIHFFIEPAVMGRQGAIEMLAIGVLGEVGLLFRYLRARHKHRQATLMYDAKLTTARALASITAQDDVVCHEFRKDNIRIDHILVGSKGIFTIHTHPRSARPDKAAGSGSTVIYDGRGLFFPKGGDGGMLGRACESAEWLSAWLSEELNSPVASRAIVSIPGWRVKRTSAEGIPVVNPGQFESLFAHITARPLSSGQIQTIAGLIRKTYDRET